MSHEDAVIKLPKNFRIIASTKNSKLTIIENSKKKIYGVQFHPEVTHTDNGKQIFKNFIFSICKIKKMECYFSKGRINKSYIRETLKRIKLFVLFLEV